MKVAIIGSGPAALSCYHALCSKLTNAEIHIFDYARTLDHQAGVLLDDSKAIAGFYDGLYKNSKRENGFSFPPVKTHLGVPAKRYHVDGKPRFFKSDMKGGLSNYWGATMLPFFGSDFKDWPIVRSKLDPYYEKIANLTGISGRKDSLSHVYLRDFHTSPPLRLLKGFEELDAQVNSRPSRGRFDVTSGINRASVETRQDQTSSCVYCGECMGGCFKGAVFNAAKAFELAQDTLPFQSIDARVLRINPEDRKIHYLKDDHLETSSSFDRIYLCAGAIGSTEIILRSVGIKESVSLVDNTIFQFPLLNLNLFRSDNNKKDYFSLTNLLFTCTPRDPGEYSAQVQLYPNFDYLWRNCMPEAIWNLSKGLVRWSRDRLMWARLYLHSDYSSQYKVRLDPSSDRLELEETQLPNFAKAKEVMESIKSAVNRNRFWIPPLPPIASKTSNHLAGPFPYDNNLAGIKADGALAKGIYVCDSSCFPASPATSPTFTIMANAYRITDESLV